MINIDNSTWHITQDLDSESVPTIIKKFDRSIPLLDWELDLSQCNHIDSSGLALLIKYIKHAKTKDIKLKITGIDSDSMLLAKVHGVSELLSPAK